MQPVTLPGYRNWRELIETQVCNSVLENPVLLLIGHRSENTDKNRKFTIEGYFTNIAFM